MTATNHALTGALIGLVIGQPWVALPVSFLSHFICDAIPHFDPVMPTDQWIKTRKFRNLLIADGSLCMLLVTILAIVQPSYWLLASFCAFLATSPDLFWINQFITTRRGMVWRPNAFSRFASAIQWFTAPIGAVVEAVWFLSCLTLLHIYVR